MRGPTTLSSAAIASIAMRACSRSVGAVDALDQAEAQQRHVDERLDGADEQLLDRDRGQLGERRAELVLAHRATGSCSTDERISATCSAKISRWVSPASMRRM